eukprot:gene10936-22831_t
MSKTLSVDDPRLIRALQVVGELKSASGKADAQAKEKQTREDKQAESDRPLEEALHEIRQLKGKLDRREDALRVLRKQAVVDVLRCKLNTTDESDLRQFISEDEKSNAIKIYELEDSLQISQTTIREQLNEIEKLKLKIQRDHGILLEKSFSHQKELFQATDRANRLEIEKKNLTNLLSGKDSVIERQSKEIEQLQREIQVNTKAEDLKRQYDDIFQRLVISSETVAERDRTIREMSEQHALLKATTKTDEEYDDMKRRLQELVESLDILLAGDALHQHQHQHQQQSSPFYPHSSTAATTPGNTTATATATGARSISRARMTSPTTATAAGMSVKSPNIAIMPLAIVPPGQGLGLGHGGNGNGNGNGNTDATTEGMFISHPTAPPTTTSTNNNNTTTAIISASASKGHKRPVSASTSTHVVRTESRIKGRQTAMQQQQQQQQKLQQQQQHVVEIGQMENTSANEQQQQQQQQQVETGDSYNNNGVNFDDQFGNTTTTATAIYRKQVTGAYRIKDAEQLTHKEDNVKRLLGMKLKLYYEEKENAEIAREESVIDQYEREIKDLEIRIVVLQDEVANYNKLQMDVIEMEYEKKTLILNKESLENDLREHADE